LARIACVALLSALSVTTGAQVPRGALEPEDANEARLNRLQPPDAVMDAIGLKQGMTAAEIGAGRGRYVMHLANRVGAQGRVYAEDIDASALSHLRDRCRKWDIRNVEIVVGDVTDPKLPAWTLDLIFIISSYHHFQDPVALLRNARAALKPDGVVAIGEWAPAGGGGEYVTPEQMISQMGAAGFRLERLDPLLKASGMNLFIFKLRNQ
jgi:ubiquinone/menaquinone biosynthesis C-methylase UbiE